MQTLDGSAPASKSDPSRLAISAVDLAIGVPMIGVTDIIVGTRHRKELGDLDTLANSIDKVGLLQPLVLNLQTKELIAGFRRLEALKRLGWKIAPVRFVNLDALLVLQAERDENTVRLDFAPSEAVAIGKALEAMERAQAKARMSEGGRVGKLPDPAKKGRVRDKVARAVGMGGKTYSKARKVVAEAKRDPRLQPLVDEMDRTGKVDGAHKKVLAHIAGTTSTTPAAPAASGAATNADETTTKPNMRPIITRFVAAIALIETSAKEIRLDEVGTADRQQVVYLLLRGETALRSLATVLASRTN
jgi:ParB-like chromosome segregation protein Spo0J